MVLMVPLPAREALGHMLPGAEALQHLLPEPVVSRRLMHVETPARISHHSPDCRAVHLFRHSGHPNIHSVGPITSGLIGLLEAHDAAEGALLAALVLLNLRGQPRLQLF
jgi:hypothetical protein